jgi:hypothetical protein
MAALWGRRSYAVTAAAATAAATHRRCTALLPASPRRPPTTPQVFREVKFFGDAEISTLKKELESHKVQLQQLKAQRQERQRREEALALLEMRKAVEHLQKMESLLAEQDQQVGGRGGGGGRSIVARSGLSSSS